MSYPLLSRIDDSADLRKLSPDELQELCHEIRTKLIETVSKTGGHLSSNLGIVELTLALHLCYDVYSDSIIYDVGHQVYPHKLLTGRFKNFDSLKQRGGLSGYPNPAESASDLFFTSHASTAISSALGIACANSHRGKTSKAIAVVGDGAMTGGIAFEALNNAGAHSSDLLVILNDNEMSISPSVGALNSSLAKIRATPRYNVIKESVNRFIKRLPGGNFIFSIHKYFMTLTKSALTPGSIFREMGFRCFGPIDGNNLPLLVDEINNLKKLEGPLLLHVLTKKGKGYDPAQKNPSDFHGVSPFEPYSIPTSDEVPQIDKPSYTAIFKRTLIKLAEGNNSIMAITAAMAQGTGLDEFEKRFPRRYFDVGIAEQHAVCFGAALAKGGVKPVVAIYSSFLQRAYDQLFHDVALQKLAPVFCLDRAGLVGSDGPSQHGLFDIAYLRHLPNMVLMAPGSAAELSAMMEFAFTQNVATAIRYPKARADEPHPAAIAPVELGKAEVIRHDGEVLLVSYGALLAETMRAADILNERGIDCAVINARFAKPLDCESIIECSRENSLIITIEDHARQGGFGSALLEELNDAAAQRRLVRLGTPDRFIDHASRSQQLHEIGLDALGIVATVEKHL